MEIVREEGGPAKRAAFLAAGALLAVALVTSCAGDPPQIVDYSPQRNTIDISTAVPITITFDHDVDRSSVESRLHLVPPTTGSVRWLNGRTLVYDHETLRTSTTYSVVLEPGYRDPSGNAYTLRHQWAFVTEGPPALNGSSPANGDTAVDPASYLILDFTREMNPATLKSAIAISPSAPFDVRIDPTDGHRAIIAPAQLLNSNTAYRVLVNTAAVDVDGNQLGRDEVVRFNTGPQRALRHWIAFATDTADGTPGGLWMVDERGFPRELFDASAVRAFTWSPSGDSLVIQGVDNTWWNFTPGGGETPLTFKAAWAASLAAGMGYAYIDATSTLHRLAADGTDEVIARNVAEAAVAPNGLRVAFIEGISGSDEIRGYDVGLRASYQLALDTAPVTAIAWAPAGNRIAYLRHDLTTVTLRVRNLTGAATTTTLTSGDLGPPAWLPDSSHLVFAATLASQNAAHSKAFVVNVVSPPATLSLAAGLPADPAIDVTSPVASPDGHQIAFLSGDQVWLMNADGTRPTALTKADAASFPYSCRALAWTRG